MADLKRCPFCGGKARYRYEMPYNVVQCSKCKVCGLTVADAYEQQDGKETAIKAWNRRADNGNKESV
nr:MAG TPA: restriction alleviation protein [Caudoviricetes sp.]